MEYRDYYATLGVPRTATQAEIKRAFRKLARENHPDVRKGDKAAEQRFKEINEANAVLSDTDKRQAYDRLGADWEAYQRAGASAPFGAGAPPFGGFGGGNVRFEYHGDPEDLEQFSDFFRTFFGATPDEPVSSGGRRRSGRAFGIDDLFGGLAGRGRSGVGNGAARGAARQDVEAAAEIDLDEVERGTTRLVSVDGKRLEVTIPAGVASGQRIRLTGKAPGGGDLYVVVRVREHPVFSRTGADLRREIPITLAEALLGAEIPVETLRGRVMLRVPPETQNGRSFRLAGQGLPRFRGDGRGDLYVRVRVVLPTGLDDEARSLVQRLADDTKQPDPRQRSHGATARDR